MAAIRAVPEQPAATTVRQATAEELAAIRAVPEQPAATTVRQADAVTPDELAVRDADAATPDEIPTPDQRFADDAVEQARLAKLEEEAKLLHKQRKLDSQNWLRKPNKLEFWKPHAEPQQSMRQHL